MLHSKHSFLFVLVFLAVSLKAQEMSLDSNYVKQAIRLAQTETDEAAVFDQMENALLVARSINYQTGKAIVAEWLGNYYRQKGDNISALRYLLELLEVQEKLKETDLKKQTLFSIAQIYQAEQLYDKALDYYRILLSMSVNQSLVWEQMGTAFSAENQVDSAVYYVTKVYEQAIAKNDYAKSRNALQQRVLVYQKAGNLAAVLKDNLAILTLVQQNNDTPLLTTCYNNLGYDYNKLKAYEKAIEYFEKAEEANERDAILDKSVLYTNLGITYQNTGNLTKAIQYLRKAKQALNKDSAQGRLAYLTHLISTVYYKSNDLYNALIFNDEALLAGNQNADTEVLSAIYNMGALIHQELYDYEKALDYYKKHLALRDSFLLEFRVRQQALLQQQYLLERAEKEINILISNQEIKDLSINQLNLEKEKLELSSISLKLEAEKRENELTLLRKEQEIKDATFKNKELEALQTQQTLRLTAQQLEAEKQEREIAELNIKEAQQNLALAQKEAEEKERLKEIDMLSKDKELLTRQQEITQLELDKQATFRKFVYGLGALAGIILALIMGGLLLARRANKRLAVEKSKSDALLLNILPLETANELKNTGIANPRQYDLVSVLFTDFSRFTSISKNMSAQQLINELNDCFMKFDEIVERYGLEKIKTIGDAYMCAGGIPTANTTNPTDTVLAALEMQAFMAKRLSEKQQQQENYWGMRIGIHTGSVIAGVVGTKKFAYDIWGDTVNIASRMESSSQVGAINISAATYAHIKDDFACTYRGAISIKHGGEVEMYFVEGKRNL